MSEKITYRLYAMFIMHETLDIASKERFCRITPNYALVYTDKELEGKGIREITDKEMYRLSEVENQWLLDCNVILITENTMDNEAEFIKQMSARLEAVEKVLAESKE